MTIGPNKDINKAVVYHKKWSANPSKSGRAEGSARAAPKRHLVNGTNKPHNDEKLAIRLLIMGAWLISYHFM